MSEGPEERKDFGILLLTNPDELKEKGGARRAKNQGECFKSSHPLKVGLALQEKTQ